MEKEERLYKSHPILFSILIALLIGTVGTFLCFFKVEKSVDAEEMTTAALTGVLVAAFFVYPFVLTCYEGLNLYLESRQRADKWQCIGFDMLVLFLGISYELLYMMIVKEIEFFSDWQVQLSNTTRHVAVYTQALPTLIAICAIAFAGYLVLTFVPLRKMPPLVVVLSMSAMYLGTFVPFFLMIQMYHREDLMDLYLLLLPLNCILIAARTTLKKVREWEALPMEKARIFRNPFLNFCDSVLKNARLWPLLAFVLMFPLLGILIMILLLFGQAPDSVIKAWTETSDWNLSRRQAPQNLYYDEHYLCTVAAGGHSKVVKPQRLGIRHGHEVIVNRQLCIANAFEQVLEERMPRVHRRVRSFYDTYGFPIAKLIHNRFAADLIYFLMKPLEWLFLIVLYLVDVHPEDRIAVQYTGKSCTEVLNG